MLSRYRKLGVARPLSQVGLADSMNVAAQLRSEWVVLRDVAVTEALTEKRKDDATQPKQDKVDEMKNLYYQQENALKQTVGAAVRSEVQSKCLQVPQGTHYILGSAPEFSLQEEPVLALCATVVDSLGFSNVAGDGRDKFHRELMTKEEMEHDLKGWRIAWKGRCKTAVDIILKQFPHAKIVIVTLDGGLECQWEVKQIDTGIIPFFGDVNVQRLHYTTWQELVKDMCDYDVSAPDNSAASTSSPPTSLRQGVTGHGNIDLEANAEHCAVPDEVQLQAPLSASTSSGGCCKRRLRKRKCRCAILLAFVILLGAGGAGYVVTKEHGSSSTCASHPSCHARGLEGECCPTDKGVTLDCCQQLESGHGALRAIQN